MTAASRCSRFAALAIAAALVAVSACSSQDTPVGESVLSATVTGAGFTTVNEVADGAGHCANGNPEVNCNIYDGKSYVWLNGGPAVAYVGDGRYFFAVLAPGGQADPNDGTPRNLSDDYDAYTNRIFSVNGGSVSYSGSHDFRENKIRLAPYADTSNPGGVYIMAICSLADDYPVRPSKCKYDAFKVKAKERKGLALAVLKDANGSYTNTYDWDIAKDVDKTEIKQLGGTATFKYRVTVTHDNGTISGVKVSGTISVFNPNLDGGNHIVPVDIAGIADQLSDGTACSVTGGGPQRLTEFQTDFAYECDLAALPAGPIDNLVTVSWSRQSLSNGARLEAGSASFILANISFSESAVDECGDVTDSYAGILGTVCIGDENPRTYSYDRTVPVPVSGCQGYDNIATVTANDSGATDSASQSVRVCGPLQTGAHTIGFWQNPNGQFVIAQGESTLEVCDSGSWLRRFAPFQDLSPTASCNDVALYVYGVIKAANAGGDSMNAMLKAQDLATSLDAYFSDLALGGNKINAPAPIGGVVVDLTSICASFASGACSAWEDASAAFGGASSLTVLELLTYAAGQSNAGGSLWYGNVKEMQKLAKDTFDAINNQIVFAP